MSTIEQCDQCKEKGTLGRDIRAYRFLAPNGTPVIRYLHPSGGERRCFHLFESKYNDYIAQRKVKASG